MREEGGAPTNPRRFADAGGVPSEIGHSITGIVINMQYYIDSYSSMSYNIGIEVNNQMSDNRITSDLLLSEADRYGYEIVKLIAERSGGEYELKEATTYSSVRRLETDGDIEWYWGDESQGGRRKYFRITPKGKATYARNKSNWQYAKRVLDRLL